MRGEGKELVLQQQMRLVFQGGVTAVTAQTVEVTKQNKRVLRFESGFAIDAAAVVMDNGVLRKADELLMVLEILPIQQPKRAEKEGYNKDAKGRAVVFRLQELQECAEDLSEEELKTEVDAGTCEIKPQRWVLSEKNKTLSPHHMPKYALGWGMNPEIEEVGLILVKLGTPEEVRLVSTGRVAKDDGAGNATNASCGMDEVWWEDDFQDVLDNEGTVTGGYLIEKACEKIRDPYLCDCSDLCHWRRFRRAGTNVTTCVVDDRKAFTVGADVDQVHKVFNRFERMCYYHGFQDSCEDDCSNWGMGALAPSLGVATVAVFLTFF
jgi:hypothetical protein